MNYRNTPFLRLIIPFGIGIIAGDYFLLSFSLPFQWLFLLCLSSITLAAAGWKYAFQYRWVFGALAQLTFFALGYWYVNTHDERNQHDHFSSLIHPDSLVTIAGNVIDMPVPGARYKVPLAVEYLQKPGEGWQPCSGNAMLFISADTADQPVRYGDKVMVTTRIGEVKPPSNPHAFDYKQYLHHQNIHYNAYLKKEQLTVVAQGEGNWIWEKAFYYRDRLLAILRQYFPGEEEYAVASALLVGYKEDLSDELKTSYAETGSMHALAVSGTHVGLLYIGLLFLLERLPLRGRRGRLIETLLALLAIWAFTFLTGATASVLRASVMFSTHLVGKTIFRQANVWNVLSASAFILLVGNPYFIFDAGFQLSYAAVVGMAFFYPMLFKVSPVMRFKWLDEGWKVLLVGVSAQIGTLPLSLYYFHQFPCYFWLAGWVVVLGGAVFLWAGALLILLDALSNFWAGWLGFLLNGMLWLMNKIIVGIQHLPGSVITGIWLSGAGAILLYCILAFLGGAIALKKTKALMVALAGMACLLLAGAFRSMGQEHQQSVCIYSVNKARLIDIFDGHHRTTFSENTTSKQETFAAQTHRWACGVPHQTGDGIPFNSDTILPHIQLNKNIIKFNNLKLLFADDPSFINTTAVPESITAIVMSNDTEIELSDCIKKYPCSQIIIDQTNHWKKIRRWKSEAEDLGLSVWDIREQGAWIWSY